MTGMTLPLVLPNNIQPEPKIVQKAREFLDNFDIYEITNSVPVMLHFDKKSEAYYLTCRLDGKTLAKKADSNAVLDPDETEDYKLNRELSLDKYEYKLMQKDAVDGRSFEDIVLEYDTSYRAEKPLKIYGGQHRIHAIQEAANKDVSVMHGVRVYFNLSRDQKVEIATVNNTSIDVPTDLLDRMQEDQMGSELRDWAQSVGLLKNNNNFSDRGASDIPTVRIARTLIVNFYKGKNNTVNSFHEPIVCASGSGVDKDYEAVRKLWTGMMLTSKRWEKNL